MTSCYPKRWNGMADKVDIPSVDVHVFICADCGAWERHTPDDWHDLLR